LKLTEGQAKSSPRQQRTVRPAYNSGLVPDKKITECALEPGAEIRPALAP